jgi:glucokinase
MKYILGIDVGGTKISSGLVDKQNQVSQYKIRPTSQRDLLGQLASLVAEYQGFVGIGIGVPGQVLYSGMVTHLPNVAWRPTNLRVFLNRRFRVPVNVMNDAKAFTLAEAVAGSGKKFKSVVGITMGTGIGVGFIKDGKMYFGKDGIAGEFDHVVLPDGKIIRKIKQRLGKFRNAQSAKNFLQSLLSMTVLSFNPEVIILGGAWSQLTGMARTANRLTTNLGGFVTKTPVKISKLKYAGIIGAALPLLG